MTPNTFLQQSNHGRNEFWRYLVTLAAIIFISIWVSLIIGIAAIFFEGTDLSQFSETTILLLGMAPFPFILLALWFGVRFLHKRNFRSLITPLAHIQWKRIFISAGLWFILAGISDLILALLQPGNYRWSFDALRFVPYFIISIILIPIQTSTEELIFRGYLSQGMYRLSPHIWIPWIIPSVIFGLLHSLNPEVDMYGFLLTIPYYIGFGLMLGWITIRSQSLELALGVHLANNMYASLMVTFPGSALSSPALFSILKYDALLSLVVWAVMAAIYLVVIRTVGKRWFVPQSPEPVVSPQINQPD